MDTTIVRAAPASLKAEPMRTGGHRWTVHRNARSPRRRGKGGQIAAPDVVRPGTAVAEASRRRGAMRDSQQQATARGPEIQASSFAGLLRGYRFSVCTDRVATESALDVRRRVYRENCGYDVPVPDEIGARHAVVCSKEERIWTYEWLCFRRTGLVTSYAKLANAAHELLTVELQELRQRREHPLWEFVFTSRPAEMVLPPPTAQFGPVRYLGPRPVSFAAAE